MISSEKGLEESRADPDGTLTRTIGLLLGAGGIRGCAHAGVLGMIEDAGLAVDIVVGSSIGSIFGLAYAAGVTAQRIRSLVLEAPRWSVAEFYRNRLRVDRRTTIGSWLCEIGEGRCIEDLPRPFACMVLDIDSGEVEALRSGPILPAIEASIALPWIAQPVIIGGRKYRDGGLAGSIPAYVAREMGANYVISVELSRPSPHGGLRSLAARPLRVRRLRPGKGSAVRVRESVAVSRVPHGCAGSRQMVSAGLRPDFVIRPHFYGLSQSSPMGALFCMRQGEAAARLALRGTNLA